MVPWSEVRMLLIQFYSLLRCLFSISIVALQDNTLDIQSGLDYVVCLISVTQCPSYVV